MRTVSGSNAPVLNFCGDVDTRRLCRLPPRDRAGDEKPCALSADCSHSLKGGDVLVVVSAVEVLVGSVASVVVSRLFVVLHGKVGGLAEAVAVLAVDRVQRRRETWREDGGLGDVVAVGSGLDSISCAAVVLDGGTVAVDSTGGDVVGVLGCSVCMFMSTSSAGGVGSRSPRPIPSMLAAGVRTARSGRVVAAPVLTARVGVCRCVNSEF